MPEDEDSDKDADCEEGQERYVGDGEEVIQVGVNLGYAGNDGVMVEGDGGMHEVGEGCEEEEEGAEEE